MRSTREAALRPPVSATDQPYVRTNRPPTFGPELIEYYAQFPKMPDAYIAALCGVSIERLERAMRTRRYREAWIRGRAALQMRIAARKAAIAFRDIDGKPMPGAADMLMYLDETEGRPRQKPPPPTPLRVFDPEQMSDAELRAAIEAIQDRRRRLDVDGEFKRIAGP